MANNYLPTLAFQPYIAPQQDLPVEEFNNLGTTLNKRYDENISKWDELDAYINQVQLSDADNSIKDSVLKDTRQAIKGIRENGNWENGKLQIREVAKRLANDQALSVAQQNFKKAQAQRDEEGKLRMQGINLIDFNQGRFNQTTIDPITGRARTLDYSGTEKLQDYNARRASLFEGLQADGYDNESSSPVFNQSNGMVFQVGSGSSAKFVTAKKIKEIAKRNLDNYLSTAEGQQEYKMLTTSNSMNPQPLKPSDAKKQILDGITNTGLTRTFNQTSSKSSQSVVSLGTYGRQAAAELPPNTQLEGAQIEGNVANPVFASLTEILSPDRIRTGKANESRAFGVPTGASNIMISSVGGDKSQLKFSKEQKNAFDKIAMALDIKGNNGKYSNADIAKVRKFAEERANTGVSMAIRTFTDEEIGKAKNYAANGNYRARQFYSPEDKKFLTYDELPQEAREKLESGKTEGIQFQGVVDTDNPLSDMAKKSKKFTETTGWVSPESIAIGGKQFIVSSSLSDKNKLDINNRQLQQSISRANRTGVPIYLSDGKSKELIVPVGKGLYQIKDTKGNLVHQGNFTKEQMALYAQQYNLTPEEE